QLLHAVYCGQEIAVAVDGVFATRLLAPHLVEVQILVVFNHVRLLIDSSITSPAAGAGKARGSVRDCAKCRTSQGIPYLVHALSLLCQYNSSGIPRNRFRDSADSVRQFGTSETKTGEQVLACSRVRM